MPFEIILGSLNVNLILTSDLREEYETTVKLTSPSRPTLFNTLNLIVLLLIPLDNS